MIGAGDWEYEYMSSRPRHWMEVRGQIAVLGALPSGVPFRMHMGVPGKSWALPGL